MRNRKKEKSDLLRNQADCERIAKFISPELTPEKMEQENNKKINGARELLARSYLIGTDMDIQDVAWILGYESEEDFARAFVVWTGMEPEKFRKKQPGKARRSHAGLSAAW